jgi:AraC-like DNA-binding protein
MEQDVVIAMHRNSNFFGRLKPHLPDTVTVLEKKKMRMLKQEARMKPISCVILHVDKDIPEEPHFVRFKKDFPKVPCIAVLGSRNMELARHCGAMGIESVLPYDGIESISDEIARVLTLKNDKVFLTDISINKMNVKYSEMVKEALSIIEQNYVKMFNTNEIADLLGIAEATLSREFVKFDLPGPKKILIQMKLEHAIKLMQNSGLNIREIALLSGFTEEKRMAECFHRTFGMPPGAFRIKNFTRFRA